MFCGSCGKPLAEGVKFCPECGAPVRRAPAVPEPSAPAPQPTAAPVVSVPVPQSAPAAAAAAPAMAAAAAKNIEQALMVAPILLAVGAGLVVMTGDLLNFLFVLGVAAVAYAVGYKNYKDGKLKEAKTGALIMGIVVGVFFLISAGQGNMIFTLLDAVSAAALIFASTKLP